MANVKLNKPSHEMVTAISEKRKAEYNPVKTIQAILEELIAKQYKREINRGIK